METVNHMAMLAAAAAGSFAAALLLNWAMLSALFHLLPRPARPKASGLALSTPPGEALPEPGRVVPALPGVLRRVGPGPRPAASSVLASGFPIH